MVGRHWVLGVWLGAAALVWTPGCSDSSPADDGAGKGGAGKNAGRTGDDGGPSGTGNGGDADGATGGTGGKGKGNTGSGSSSSGGTGGGHGGKSGSASSGDGGSDAGETETTPPPGPPGCGLENAAFCDTFDKTSPGGNAGDLDDALWSPARVTTDVNLGQGHLVKFAPTGKVTVCDKDFSGRLPPEDMFFCAGGATPSMHFNDSYNDTGTFTVHSWRIRQPFDFANRTGIIAFDGAIKAAIPGGHGFWFNVFISEEPVPAPYQDGTGISLFTKAGVAIEFEAGSNGQCKGDGGIENSVSNILVQKDFTTTEIAGHGDSKFGNEQTGGAQYSKCFTTKDEHMNHVEIHVNQTSIEVYASDADDPNSFQLIAVAHDLTIPFTRGYVSFQQTHYNAGKCTGLYPETQACQQCDDTCPHLPPWTTYEMDNVGFDGPVLPTPRAYEVPNNTYSSRDNETEKTAMYLPDGSQINDLAFPDPQIHIGYELTTDANLAAGGVKADHSSKDLTPLVFHDVDLKDATDALVTLNAWNGCDPMKYRFNGGTWQTYETPAVLNTNSNHNCSQATARALPVPLEDLKTGDNTLEIYSSLNSEILGAAVSSIELTVNTK